MKQILFIHGGDSYSSYEAFMQDLKSQPLYYDRIKYHRSFTSWIAEQMPNTDVLTPSFPNSHNAKFDEWSVYFEKLIPFFNSETIIVGHSLGAMFLAKYLHENKLPIVIDKIVLLSGAHGSAENQEGCGSFLVESASGVDKSCRSVHLFHSEDDPVVPYDSLRFFVDDLPNADVHTYKDQGHFNIPTFPDLLKLLQQK